MAGLHFREWLIGSPLPTERLESERLDTLRALAVLSPDALSSIAYANQEIFLGLVVAGSIGLSYSFPIALAIVVLLGILTLSYSQTIQAYPRGGGSYTVAKENLGTPMGLVAAAALLVDYTLVAAVSLTAGVAAIASAFPELWPYRVVISLFLLVVITLANLRGLRESGTLISFPVYLFILAYIALFIVALLRTILGDLDPLPVDGFPVGQTVSVTLFLVLHTFASGCTALTGVEAISNGVQIFKPPQARHARQAMRAVAVLMMALFLGTVGLTQYFKVLPLGEETILSALARHVFGAGWMYYLVQASTLLVLLVAANTSFAGFPRVASILAEDSYLPRQLAYLGDRLVFNNGMLLLASLTGALIVLFGGDTHALIPLFAVGVFVAFTLSQAGMVVHWSHLKGKGWLQKALINGLGALTTMLAFVIIAVSKFLDGAWIVALLIPLIILGFRAVHRHYLEIAEELSVQHAVPSVEPLQHPRVVIPVASVHRGVIYALRYALSISNRVNAIYIEVDPSRTEKVKTLWEQWGMGVPLRIVPSPYRSVIGPFLDYLDKMDPEAGDGQLATVILPEFVPAKWWEHLLHNQTAWLLKLALLYRRRKYGKVRAIIDIPVHLRR
jgi:amino acid transporter